MGTWCQVVALNTPRASIVSLPDEIVGGRTVVRVAQYNGKPHSSVAGVPPCTVGYVVVREFC